MAQVTTAPQGKRATPQTEVTAYVALGLGILFISFSAIFISWANAPETVTGFYRMGIATAVLAVPFARRVGTHGRLPWREVLIAAGAGIFFGSDLIFWNAGILLSGAANPTLMANTAPIWVALGAMLFFRERLGRLFWLGLAAAMTGAALIFGTDLAHSVGIGTFFGLIAGVFYAAYLLATQQGRRTLDALSFFWIAAAAATLLLFVASLALHRPLTGYSTVTRLNFLALGIINQVCGQFVVTYALGTPPASSLVSPTLLAQPLLTMVWAVLLWGQVLSVRHVAGRAHAAGRHLHRAPEPACPHVNRQVGIEKRRAKAAPFLFRCTKTPEAFTVACWPRFSAGTTMALPALRCRPRRPGPKNPPSPTCRRSWAGRSYLAGHGRQIAPARFRSQAKVISAQRGNRSPGRCTWWW
ncbi:MAG: DMT family transporter [Caldilineaceae bacterium]